MTRLAPPASVGGAPRHARERRAHLAGDAEHDDVALEVGERLDDAPGRLAEQLVEVSLVGNGRRKRYPWHATIVSTSHPVTSYE